MGKIFLPTATSGIAAANIPTGRTAHSRFKLPIDLESSLICNVPKQGSLAALLKQTNLIIWDEASMANKLSIHSLDLLLRDLCKGTLPFGGKIIVFGGDFRQVLPVVPKKSQKEAVLASLVCSPLWPEFKRFHLTKNMRAREDPAYASFLLSLGNGSLQKNESTSIPLPSEIILENGDNRNSLQALFEFVFPTLGSGSIDVTHLNDRAILKPKNADVDYVNNLFIT